MVRGAAAIGAWARVENAATARRLAAMADVLDSRLAEDGSANREQWCLDNWDSVSAEVAAAQGVSLGVASRELLVAAQLRERMPRVSEVFASGRITYRMVKAIVTRTRLATDPEVKAKLDIEIAAAVLGWGTLSVEKVEKAIDSWVDRYDPYAVVRAESRSRSRRVDVVRDTRGTGVSWVECVLLDHDAAALDARLDGMARGVCAGDPRTLDQRRSDAMGALAAKSDRLACLCGSADCAAAERTPSVVVVHVIAEETSLADGTPVTLDGVAPREPWQDKPIREVTVREALTPSPPTGPALTNPAVIIGGTVIPAPLLAAKIAVGATIRPLVHPGQSPPEPRYVPSQKLADFVRCRDMTCRFPGCDAPADHCDVDHTIAYPVGPTQASNLKCLCRKHHLLKTFWGWTDVQSPDGTVVWTSPGGQTYTTVPGSLALFPSLCRPTASVNAPANVPATQPNRGLTMPRRTMTRAQDRAKRVEAERARNQELREPRDGERRDGEPRDGESRDGEPRDGERRDGESRDGDGGESRECGGGGPYLPFGPRYPRGDDPPPF